MDPEHVVVMLVAMAFGVVVVDILLALDGRPGNTFSAVLRDAGRRWLPVVILISFGMGLLAGHIWW